MEELTRKERLSDAFEYVKANFGVGTQKELAEKMESTQPNVSSAMKGDPKALTDSFLKRFNAAFGGIFNTRWLLNGEGEMLRSSPIMSQDGNGGNHQQGHAFRDLKQIINPPCTYAINTVLKEIEAYRKLAEEAIATSKKTQEQLDKALDQILGLVNLITKNKE